MVPQDLWTILNTINNLVIFTLKHKVLVHHVNTKTVRLRLYSILTDNRNLNWVSNHCHKKFLTKTCHKIGDTYSQISFSQSLHHFSPLLLSSLLHLENLQVNIGFSVGSQLFNLILKNKLLGKKVMEPSDRLFCSNHTYFLWDFPRCLSPPL